MGFSHPCRARPEDGRGREREEGYFLILSLASSYASSALSPIFRPVATVLSLAFFAPRFVA